jgi:hypothetical protein
MTTFLTIDDLQQWLSESGAALSDVQMELPSTLGVNTVETTTGSTIYVSTDISITEPHTPVVNVKSLSEAPVITLKPLTESEDDYNTWVVDDFECMEGACGTCKVVYKGDTLLMNVCECEGKSTVSLILEIDGKISTVPFVLEKSCNTDDECDMILAV